MATANAGQGQAGGAIHTPGNIGPDTGGVMHGKEISDAPVVSNNATTPPYPTVKEVKLSTVNDQEF